MPITGTANLDRNRAFVAVAGTGPNSEATVHIPLGALVDATGAALGTALNPLVTEGAAGADKEIVVTAYRVKTAFTGASVGDTVTAIRVLDLSGVTPTQEGATIWYNESTAAALGSAPAAANIEIFNASALTDAQLRAAAVSVSNTPLTDALKGEYGFVAASTTAALGATGATGDFLSHLTVTPLTAACGTITLQDGGGTARTLFAGGGTTALPSLAPFTIVVQAYSAAGAWTVATGANVQLHAVGNFT